MIILAFTQISFAGEAEDAVSAIFGKAQSLDVAQGNEAAINEQAQNIAPHNLGEIDAQLKQLEQNYKDQIDASTNQQHHDPLLTDLSAQNPASAGAQIKELAQQRAATAKKFTISPNDELLTVAREIEKSTPVDAQSEVFVPEIVTSNFKGSDKIFTCREAGDEVIKKCYRTRIVKARQPEETTFTTELYYAANSYAGHTTVADLKSGKIDHNGAAPHGGSKIINSFDERAPNAEIISITRTGGDWWHSAGVHTHDTHNNITWPTEANGYVYRNSIDQGSMGSRKNRERNGHKNRGRVERWEVVARPAPVIEESWDEGACPELFDFAQKNFCEGPVTNLIDVEQSRMIANYPHPVQRSHWGEEHIYSCGGGSIANECQTLRDAGCSQVDSQCISTRGPFCVEFMQTYNCGKSRVNTNLSTNGNTIAIEKGENAGVDDSFEVEDFGNAIGQLSIIDEMKKNILRPSDGTVLLFKGDRLTCDKDLGSDIKNCCNLKGIFKNIIGHKCPKEVEEILAPAVIRERRCVEVANWYCINKAFGKCIKWRKSFCCYQGRLARIFQQIAHHQLGISWGNAEHPNCGPLDPHTFGKLNFEDPYARQLLKELVDEANVNAQNYANKANAQLAGADLTRKVTQLQERIGAYYDNKIKKAGID